MKKPWKRALGIVVVLLGAAALAVVSFRTGPPPEIRISPSARAIGRHTSVVVTLHAGGRGLAGVRVEVEQGGRTTVVARAAHRPAPAWALGGARRTSDEIQAEVGASAVPALTSGEATIRVVAGRASTWILHPAPVVGELKLPVRLAPPALSLVSARHYVEQGGAGVVVYRVGEGATRDGVQAGAWFFPGRPLPGADSGVRFALFGAPWDMGDDKAIRLVAEDEAGNTSRLAFVDRYFPKPPKTDRIELVDDFLGRVVSEIMAGTPGLTDRGSLLGNYLEINRELRRKQAAELVELSRQSEPRFLWQEPFVPLRNAEVMASFADERTYLYGGKEVDRETHLGYDLAATARTPVTAANSGIVRLARYFGIYGNAVVLDHGFGLMTLYGHLSSIDVKEGQQVERGALLGRTGRTGLAGGDHLHFSVLVGGLPVRPTEWWDPHWIHDRVAALLAPAVTFAGPLAVK